MGDIIVKNYEHINKALPNWDTPQGKYIKNKDHYDRCMKEAGMVSEDKASSSGPKLKEYEISNKARDIINSAKASKDKNGNIKLSDRTIDAMKSIGALGVKIPDYMNIPKDAKRGGFYK